jgi:hypothetical protein
MSKYLKAYIVEITRDFSVLMTADGQFIRYNFPAGKHEIGDEVLYEDTETESAVLSQEEKQTNNFRMLKGLAIGFAAVVLIAFGSFFGVKYFNGLGSSASLKVAGEDAAALSETGLAENSKASQDSADELMLQDAASQEKAAQDTAESADSDESGSTDVTEDTSGEGPVSSPILYEGLYKMDQFNTDLFVDYPDIKIQYRVNQDGQVCPGSDVELNRELSLNFTAIREQKSFNGNIDAILRNMEQEATRTFTVLLENFTQGQEKSELIPLEEAENSFKLIIYGYFEDLQ